jgi:transcriptional regulator with XRE-family HTH domain
MQDHPLRTYRINAGLTLEAVAIRAETTKETISRIELGSRTPSLALAARLSLVTGLPIDSFVKRAEASAA